MSYKLIILFLGLSFSGFVGHFVVRFLNTRLRGYLNLEKKHSAKLTATLGVLERVIYSSCILAGENFYTYAGIFFGLKIAQRLIVFSKIDSPEKLEDVGQRTNVYFICNIVSLAFGIVSGIIIRYLWSYEPK